MAISNPRQLMTITDAAAERVKKLVATSAEPAVGLRVGVKNGGCAGMSYTVDLAADIQPGDSLVEDKGVKVLIDPKAILFLIGARMDFVTTKMSSTFVFDNPNQTGSCGCGESVALTPAQPEAMAQENA